ncbi:MAG: diaminopimelate decarboxylase [Cyanobacteriota bacterium]|nr:diaminopimelate decarboxylase [Cyanobacteriota bacterium]
MVSTPSLEVPARVPTTAKQYLPSDSTDESLSPNQQLLPLTARINDRDGLEIGGCDVATLVERFGSPLYVLDEDTLRTACRQYREAFDRYYKGEALAIYASKAWNCLSICAIVASEGLGIDVVSGGELYTAVQAGMDASTIYFHGNNKSRSELAQAIAAGCTIVADNWLELETLVDLTRDAERPTRIMLRFTPGIECHTHEYIKTGHIDSKFGFDPDSMERVFEFLQGQTNLDCIGLHAHIGSQIFELQPHRDLPGVMVSWLQLAERYNLPIRELNVGGGLGIRYTEDDDPPSIDDWVRVVSESIATACEEAGVPLPRLICEPGRSLIGSACVTAYTVGSSKTIPGMRTYVTVDGGMSDNPRPITYQSLYRAAIANRMSAPLTETVTVAGKHCESGDVVIQEAQLPKTEPGDVLVVMGTGAYNYSMSSNYNRLPRPAAIAVKDGEANIILQRETYQDLIRQDCLPDRLRSDRS